MKAVKFPGRPQWSMSELGLFLVANVTLAELNASKVIHAQDIDMTLTPVGVWVRSNGAFITLTDMRLSTYDVNGGAAVDIATIIAANLTDGAKWTEQNAEMVLGAGFGVAATRGYGLQVRKTGGTAAGGTSLDLIVRFTKSQS